MCLGGICIHSHSECLLGFPAGLSRPGKSREGPGTGRDRTGPRDLEGPVVLAGQDLETLKVPWSCGPGTKEVQKSRDLQKKSLAPFPGQDFANKVHH